MTRKSESQSEATTMRQVLAGYRRMLTVGELAELLQCSHKTIYRRARAHVIPSRMIGNQLRFDPAQIADWLDGKHS
jgi:excisionase family DNA binding protein